jgi:hypothetical protein
MPHCIISWAWPTLRQKGRFAALIGAGNDHGILLVSVDIIANHSAIDVQAQSDIVQAAARKVPFLGGQRFRKADRLAVPPQPVGEVHTADVERQLGTQQIEKTEDVIGRLAKRVGRQIDPAVAQLRH